MTHAEESQGRALRCLYRTTYEVIGPLLAGAGLDTSDSTGSRFDKRNTKAQVADLGLRRHDADTPNPTYP
jgi:hypothetical protein